MTFEKLKELAEWHAVEAKDHLENAELFGDAPAGAELRAAGEAHQQWAASLSALLSTEVEQVAGMSAEEARHGLAMAGKVIAAMESERRQLCAEIAQLKLQPATVQT